MSEEAWIEQSLARLEELETHKAQLEAYGGDSETLAEVEAEISALYETLNAAAGGSPVQETASSEAGSAGSGKSEPTSLTGSGSPMTSTSSFDDEEDEEDEEDAWASVAARHGSTSIASSSAPSAMASSEDLFAAPSSAPSLDDPFGGSGSRAFESDDSATFDSSSFGPSDIDDDAGTSKGKLPWMAAAAALVIALGVGGFFMVKKDAGTPAQVAPVAAGEPKVITASAVPEDTQEPDAAKGADVTRTPGTVYKESSAPATKRRAPSGKKSSGKKGRRDNGSRDEDGRRVSGAASNDPLAGL